MTTNDMSSALLCTDETHKKPGYRFNHDLGTAHWKKLLNSFIIGMLRLI